VNAAARRRWSSAVVALALVATLLGGQALADARLPSLERRDAVAPVGRAGFAYLTGLRRFAAIVLFNRLEPQFHEYYVAKALKDLKFLMPNFRIITWLDPQFVQPYYMATWILFRNGRVEEALALSRESVAANPRSGLLHTAYAQLLYLDKRDVPEQVRQCDLAMREDTVWADVEEMWDSLMIIKSIYLGAGLTAKAERAQAIADALDVSPDRAPGLLDPGAQF
jgi:tetratricopeptide (TPR) repeat protein